MERAPGTNRPCEYRIPGIFAPQDNLGREKHFYHALRCPGDSEYYLGKKCNEQRLVCSRYLDVVLICLFKGFTAVKKVTKKTCFFQRLTEGFWTIIQPGSMLVLNQSIVNCKLVPLPRLW